MKVTDVLQSTEKHLSFEVFPPKRAEHFDTVRKAAEQVAVLRPSFLSITYGAGGGTGQYTHTMALEISKEFGFPVMEHLTCVSSDRAFLTARIRELGESGIQNIMALRGDLTEELKTQGLQQSEFCYAVQLIRLIRESGFDFCIGGACYPEGHPESPDREEDLRHLKEKVDAGADFLTTQMFFDNAVFYRFLDKCRQIGITVPVLPGIFPVTRLSQLQRTQKLTETLIPAPLLAIADRYREDPVSLKQAGVEYAMRQIEDLYAQGIFHVHLYVMNDAEVAEKIQHAFISRS